MSESRTLVEALERVAERGGRKYTHLIDEREAPIDVPHEALLARARRFGAALLARGLRKGDRLGLILPRSDHFVDAMYGAMAVGVIPVPVYPPMNLGKLDGYLENTTHILSRAGCGLVVTDGRVRPILGKILADTASLREIVTYDKLMSEVDEGADPGPVDIGPDDVAFLQFTSGSTAHPKGVTLTHANLMANIAAIRHGLDLSDSSNAVSWLPLYHDMGLIGFVFTPVVCQATFVRFIAPLSFLKRPALWINSLSELRAQITFAPNFAYGLATKRIKEAQIEGADLSALRVAGCGAEPIQFDTLQGFARRFEGQGFRSTMFLPCYGMAEHSLAVTFVGLGEDLRVDRVDTEAVAQGEARPVDDPEAPSTTAFVDCGLPFEGHELQIRGPEGELLAERQIGEIVLRGPSIMRGYFEDETATREAIDSEGWLRTGDLGYLVDGRLFVCGRLKDLIIVNGRNYYPQDLEWQASQVPGVRKGNVIAFGLADPGAERERVVVAAEIDDERAGPTVRSEVMQRISEQLALRVDEVLLLPPGSLPKTSSGKLQRSKARQMFLDADLGKLGATGAWATIKALAGSRWAYMRAALGPR